MNKVITLHSSNGPNGGEGTATFTPDGKLLTTDIETEFPIVQLDVAEWKKTYPDEDPVGQTHDILDWGYWFYQKLGDLALTASLGYEPPDKSFRDEFLYQTWILDPDDPKSITPDRYDKLEISPVIDSEGATHILHEAPPDNQRSQVYWSLYGHIPGQGVETIGDFKSRGHAYQTAKRLGYSK